MSTITANEKSKNQQARRTFVRRSGIRLRRTGSPNSLRLCADLLSNSPLRPAAFYQLIADSLQPVSLRARAATVRFRGKRTAGVRGGGGWERQAPTQGLSSYPRSPRDLGCGGGGGSGQAVPAGTVVPSGHTVGG